MLKAFYVRFCRAYGPRGLTFSAWAWVHAQETGDVRLRMTIDGIWMILFHESNHSQSCYQRHFQPASVGFPRERANTGD